MKKKTFFGLLGILLLAGVILFCAIGSSWFTNSDIKTWFNSWWHSSEKPTPPADDNQPDTDEGHKHTYDGTKWSFNDTHHYHKATCEHFLITDVAEHTYANGVCSVCGYKYSGTKTDMLLTGGEENGISLASSVIPKSDYIANGISTFADTAYTITATVYDEQHTTNGMPQLVEATASFENASSEWANGKNVSDYITLNRVADNSFNVVCRQAFSEPILITVTAVNSDKSAVKRCDYVKRVKSIDIEMGINDGIVVDMPTTITRNETTYGIGTLQGNITLDRIVYLTERSFVDKLVNTSYYKYFARQCTEAGFELDLGWETVKNLNVPLRDSLQLANDLCFNLADFLLSNMEVETVSAISNTVGLNYFKYAVIETAKSGDYAIRYEIHYTYNYNGIHYSSGKYQSGPPCRFNVSTLGELPPVGSIEIDGNGNIIF